MCKSKIHRATIKAAKLNYEGSLSIDEVLMNAAGIIPFELVQVANVNTGNRFETYAIVAPPNSGEICLNGAAARLGEVGDEIIIMTYALYKEEELKNFKQNVILVDKQNIIIKK